MELCGGCFTKTQERQPLTTKGVMKARQFARRFSLQPATSSREDGGVGNCGSSNRSAIREVARQSYGAAGTSGATSGAASGSAPVAGASGGAGREETTPKDRRYRVVVMGSAKVGKTAIINQFLYDSFTYKYTRTVEEMHHGEYEVSGMSLTLDILDTSGSYEFPAMRELSINQADGFILVYSITDADSFEEVRQLREFILRTKGGSVPIVVVGNKSDLEDGRKVDLETAETIVLVRWECGFLEVSAKDNLNVLHVFKELLNQAKIKYALSPAVKRRRQSMPNVGMHITPAQLSHLQHLRQKGSGKRNSCVLS